MRRDRKGRFVRVHRPERYRGWYLSVPVGKDGMRSLAEARRFVRPGGLIWVVPAHYENVAQASWRGVYGTRPC